MIDSLVRVACFLLGVPMLCLTLFSYRNETGAVQNRFDALWIALDDRTKEVGSRTVAIFNTVATADTRILDRIYGQKLLSFRMVGISCVTSMVAMLAYVVAFGKEALVLNLPPFPHKTMVTACYAILGMLLLILPAILSRSRIAALPSLLLPSLIVFFALHTLIFQDKDDDWSRIMASATLISLTSDVAANALIRRSISGIRRKFWLRGVLGAIAAQICWLLLFPVVPLALAFARAWNHPRDSVAIMFAAVGLMNLTTALLCFAFIASLAAFSAYMMFWPLLERLFYPLADLRVFSNRKVMGGVAVVLLLHGFHLTSGLMKAVAEALAK
jgi:hypothetical protein